MDTKKALVVAFMALVFLAVWNGLAGIVDATNRPILQRFNTISTITVSMPESGDVNPYPVARVKRSTGNLKEGHILMGNFNRRAGMKGKGANILDVAPDGSVAVFAHLSDETLPGSCPGGVGLTSGLVVLDGGWVIAGNLPLPDGSDSTSSGCLIVLDSMGNPVSTFSGSLINGPRELALYENNQEAMLFVTNVLNDTLEARGELVNKGTVIRINLSLPKTGVPHMESITTIGSGFPERTDPAGLVMGPTGLALSPRCSNGDGDNCQDYGEGRELLLYVADSLNNRIAVIDYPLNRTSSAGTGQTLTADGNLKDPLSLIVAPNGHILTVNRADGIITETTAEGQQIARAPAGQLRHTAWLDRHEAVEF